MQKLITGLALIAVVIFFGALVVAMGNLPATSVVDADKPPVQPTPPAATDPNAKPAGGEKPTPDATTDATKKPDVPPTPQPVQPLIEPVPIDGADIADSLKLEMYKFAFQVPEGRYTVHLWIERWTRGAAEPTNTLLLEQNGQFTEGTVLMQVPTKAWPQGLVKLGSWEVRMDEPLDIGSPVSIRSLKTAEPIEPGRDIHLVSYAYSESGRPIAGLKDVHSQNDVTIYLKARLIQGAFTPFAKPVEPPEPAKEPATPKADDAAKPAE